MAYLHPHHQALFRLVAQSDAPAPIRAMAAPLAGAPIDTVYPDGLWANVCEKISQAQWAGKRRLLRQIDRLTAGGG